MVANLWRGARALAGFLRSRAFALSLLALAAAFADKRVSGLINELGGVFGMVLGVVGAAALMLFISIISVTKAVSG